jgi:hypothetical protein
LFTAVIMRMKECAISSDPKVICFASRRVLLAGLEVGLTADLDQGIIGAVLMCCLICSRVSPDNPLVKGIPDPAIYWQAISLISPRRYGVVRLVLNLDSQQRKVTREHPYKYQWCLNGSRL